MATVVTVTTVKLFLSSAPIVRGSSTFNTPVIPVPPSAVKFAQHEDEPCDPGGMTYLLKLIQLDQQDHQEWLQPHQDQIQILNLSQQQLHPEHLQGFYVMVQKW